MAIITPINLGVGISAVSSAGGSTAGLSAISRRSGIMGKAVGSGMVLDAVGGLYPKKKKKN